VIDLEAPLVDGKIEAGHPIAASTRVDFPGAFSRDARMIAFVSTRANMTGYELWIGHPDGTGLRQVTSLAAAALVVGSWSPDGERIAFDAAVAGNSDIYVSSVHGGKPVQLTFAPSLDGQPEWSLDGKWIYFSSKATGRTPELWKVPSSGGPPEQVTHGGGFEPKFSPNGQYLYYLDRPPNGAGSPKDVSKLLRMPAAGGEAELVHDRVPPFHWSISTKGIHFLTQDESGNVYLDLYRFSDEKVVRTGQLSFRIATLPGRFIVSRDGRWALTSQTKRADADLMLLEKFR
jgi:dipeptidyl aminopeptidase/acylaminoacyl peptidase